MKNGLALVSLLALYQPNQIGPSMCVQATPPIPPPRIDLPKKPPPTKENIINSNCSVMRQISPPPSELTQFSIMSPPLYSQVSNPSSDKDFMILFFAKNNKKSFMPGNTKRLLLFDLIDHMDIAKFGARGNDFQALQKI